jgi:hypothetical protein
LYDEKDKAKTGDAIPIFFFAFDDYDPEVHFLAALPTLYGHGPSYANIVDKHRHFYSHFLNIRKIASNLELNNLLSKEELDRFWVHYNYLSYFTHPTNRGLLGIDGFKAQTAKHDSALEALGLRYSAHFQAMLLKLLSDYFSEKNTFPDLSSYVKQAEKMETLASDFWFIYNKPTQIDVEQSDMQKAWMKMQGLEVPEGLLYYSDPYERLKLNLAHKCS